MNNWGVSVDADIDNGRVHTVDAYIDEQWEDVPINADIY